MKDKADRKTYTVEDYERDAAEIERLVAAGKLSKRDAQEKLIALREAITPERKGPKANDAYGLEDYERDAARIKERLAAGKLTHAEAEKKLVSLRKKLDRTEKR